VTDAAAPSKTPSTAKRSPGTRRFAAWRWSRRLLALGIAVLAALILSFLTVDLGRIPGLKPAAERAATKYLERPMHIGKIEIRPGRGEYILRDVVIEGYVPTDRPHFEAKTIVIKTSYRTLIERQLFIDVQVRDWTMRIEKWADHHNIPKYTPREPKEPKGKGPITFRTVSHADRGTFIYEDHTTPWSIVAPNLAFDMSWSNPDNRYAGTAGFSAGTVRIQQYLPMRADMQTRFFLDGSKVTLPHIDLKTDGAQTHVVGQLDFKKWPEQSYTLASDIDFGRMKEIFFAKETWIVSGRGKFEGVFNLYKDGRDLSGNFTSDLAKVNDLQFPNLRGSLEWLPGRFAVTHAEAGFYGGDTRFAYAVEPLGTPTGSTQKFVADFERVDLQRLQELFGLKGIELRGRARGRVDMAWPSGHLKEGKTGSGELTAMPPEGVALAAADLPARFGFTRMNGVVQHSRNDAVPPLGPVPVGGELTFKFDPNGITFAESTMATPQTFISLRGRTSFEDWQADFPFRATSRDWQESARLLAAIMTAAGAPTKPVPVGGVGTFDGRMTGTFKLPRIDGCFDGDEMSAWGVNWGRGAGDVIVENKYLDLTNGVITRGEGSIRADGKFALGFPRADGGEEIHAKVRVKSWPLNDLKVAFEQTDWPIDGLIDDSELELRGKYRNELTGKGPLRIVNGTAWGETFERATADLVFKGPTVKVDNVHVAKATGSLIGDSTIGWDGSFEFNMKGERIAVESLDNFKMDRARLTGVMALTCSGKGTFDKPYYRCNATAPDLAAGDQVIGQTTADIIVDQGKLTIERLVAQSNRLTVNTTGEIVLSEPYMATLTSVFEDASIDPYFKFLTTDQKWSDLVHAVVDGTAIAKGPLSEPKKIMISAKVDKGTLSLYDYQLTNQGPLEFEYGNDRLKIIRARLEGKNNLEGTNTEVVDISGGFADNIADFTIDGKIGLELLKGPGRLSTGNAAINATVRGPLSNPDLSGRARIENGEFRYGSLPRLTEIGGELRFTSTGINAEGLTAKVGGGPVVFGGTMTVDFDDFKRSVYALTATGTEMVLRYPEGFLSKVNASLSLNGPVMAPTLEGDVEVIRASYLKRIETDPTALLGLTGGTNDTALAPVTTVGDDAVALSYNVHITAPRSSLIIESGPRTRIEGSGELQYHGEGEHATVLGRIVLDRGEVEWNGNKFRIQSGAIDFANPNRIDPAFDVAAEVRPHAPGQTYNVGVRINGTTSKLNLTLSSEPWLPEFDIIRLLLGETPDTRTAAETRALRSQQESLVQSAAATLLTSPISSGVGRVLGDLPGAPTVLIAPVIGTDINTTATARVIVGKQISDKAYISYTRTLNPVLEFILLEYEQNERLSWILSRNEDLTFTLSFRKRYVFR